MPPTLGRRVTAEAIGTGLLTAVVVGSGIAAEQAFPDEPGLQLLANGLATAGALAALILAFGALSGAHLNPVITIADLAPGGIARRDAAAYVGGQAAGACVGAMVANAMFDLAPVAISTQQRSAGALWLGELVATFGLVVVVRGVGRSLGPVATAPAVAGYIAAAYWFTSSTGFANPALTVGRTLSDTFAGIAPGSAPAFVAMQLCGGILAIAVVRCLWPATRAIEPKLDRGRDAAV